MDFEYDDEQNALRDSVRAIYKGYDTDHLREVTKSPIGFDRAQWDKLAELGALGLPFPEEAGGFGAGPIEMGIVAEEIGRAGAAEPYAWCVAVPGSLILSLGSAEQQEELIGAIASGEKVVSVAYRGEVTAAQVGDEWQLTGAKDPVFYPAADILLVVANAPDGLAVFVTTGGVRSAHRVEFDGVAATRLGAPGAAVGNALDLAVANGRIALANEALGAMTTALETTTAYLKSRKQFGVTLNRFQALTFRAADMYVALELARSVVAWATMVLAEGSPEEAHEAGLRAKLQVFKSGRLIGQEAIQLHGGIGMTAEYSVGHLTARLTAINHLLGDASDVTTELMGRLGNYDVLEPA